MGGFLELSYGLSFLVFTSYINEDVLISLQQKSLSEA